MTKDTKRSACIKSKHGCSELKGRSTRHERFTLKVNLLFLCVGSNSYRYIHLSNIAFLLGAVTYNRLFFSVDDFGSIIMYCLLIVVGSF